jgi:hypothetical protein
MWEIHAFEEAPFFWRIVCLSMRAYDPVGDMLVLNWDNGPFPCGFSVCAYLCEGVTMNMLVIV